MFFISYFGWLVFVFQSQCFVLFFYGSFSTVPCDSPSVGGFPPSSSVLTPPSASPLRLCPNAQLGSFLFPTGSSSANLWLHLTCEGQHSLKVPLFPRSIQCHLPMWLQIAALCWQIQTLTADTFLTLLSSSCHIPPRGFQHFPTRHCCCYPAFAVSFEFPICPNGTIILKVRNQKSSKLVIMEWFLSVAGHLPRDQVATPMHQPLSISIFHLLTVPLSCPSLEIAVVSQLLSLPSSWGCKS